MRTRRVRPSTVPLRTGTKGCQNKVFHNVTNTHAAHQLFFSGTTTTLMGRPSAGLRGGAPCLIIRILHPTTASLSIGSLMSTLLTYAQSGHRHLHMQDFIKSILVCKWWGCCNLLQQVPSSNHGNNFYIFPVLTCRELMIRIVNLLRYVTKAQNKIQLIKIIADYESLARKLLLISIVRFNFLRRCWLSIHYLNRSILLK